MKQVARVKNMRKEKPSEIVKLIAAVGRAFEHSEGEHLEMMEELKKNPDIARERTLFICKDSLLVKESTASLEQVFYLNMRFATPNDHVLAAIHFKKLRYGGSPQLWQLMERETRYALEKGTVNRKLLYFLVEARENKYEVNPYYFSDSTVELAE